MLKKHSIVFNNELGKIKHITAHINVKPGTTPKFCKVRPVPYTVKERVEIERLLKEGVVSPVKYSEWATPIVVVPKKDTTDVRLCADFKVTLNPVIKEGMAAPTCRLCWTF